MYVCTYVIFGFLNPSKNPFADMKNISYFVFLHSNYLKTLTEVYKVRKSMTLVSHANLIESLFLFSDIPLGFLWLYI